MVQKLVSVGICLIAIEWGSINITSANTNTYQTLPLTLSSVKRGVASHYFGSATFAMVTQTTSVIGFSSFAGDYVYYDVLGS